MKRKRTRFEVSAIGSVLVSYTDETGAYWTREFRCPQDGGYVREVMRNGDQKQVCDELSSMGNTLWCTREALPALIRREYRKMRLTAKKISHSST